MLLKPITYNNKLHYAVLGAPFSLKDQMKECLEKYFWSPPDCEKLSMTFKRENELPDKFWWCPVNVHNCVSLHRFDGVNIYERYDKKIELVHKPESSWEHQVYLTNMWVQTHFCLWAAEPRTGKTKGFLDAATIIFEGLTPTQLDDPEWVFWIITEKSCMKGIFDEIDEWGYKWKHRTVIMTYAGFRNNYDEIFIPRIVAYDEGHALRSGDGKPSIQTRTAYDITEKQYFRFGDNCYRLIATGTPAPKGPDDWFWLIKILYPGYFGLKHKKLFSHQLGDWVEKGGEGGSFKYEKLIGWKEEEVTKLASRLKGIVHTVWKKDCLDLPEIISQIEYTNPTKEQLETVEFIRTDSARNKGAQLRMNLRMISDGFLNFKKEKFDDDGEAYIETEAVRIPTGKDELFIGHLSEFKDHGRLVVYAAFTDTIKKLVDIACQEGWTVLRYDGKQKKLYDLGDTYSVTTPCTKHTFNFALDEMNRKKNTGTIERLVIIAQGNAAGKGQEFSAACSQLCYSNTDRADDRIQCQNRPHSNNMDKELGLSWIDYSCLPVDNLIIKSLKNKMDIQSITMGDIYKAMNWGEPEL